jgi:hypothetical protein
LERSTAQDREYEAPARQDEWGILSQRTRDGQRHAKPRPLPAQRDDSERRHPIAMPEDAGWDVGLCQVERNHLSLKDVAAASGW